MSNFQVDGYSGLEYGHRNTQVLVGGSSGIDSLFIVNFFCCCCCCMFMITFLSSFTLNIHQPNHVKAAGETRGHTRYLFLSTFTVD